MPKPTVKKIAPAAPTAQLKKQARAEKKENERIRHAIHGSALGENPTGVTILSSRGGGVPQKPEIMSKKGKPKK